MGVIVNVAALGRILVHVRKSGRVTISACNGACMYHPTKGCTPVRTTACGAMYMWWCISVCITASAYPIADDQTALDNSVVDVVGPVGVEGS